MIGSPCNSFFSPQELALLANEDDLDYNYVAPPKKDETTQKLNTLFQRGINAFALDLYQTMHLQREGKNKNFFFFTPNLIASLSCLFIGAPKELKEVFKETFYLEDLTEEQWHDHTKQWIEQLQNRSQNSTSSLLKTAEIGFKFQQMQFIALANPASLTLQAQQDLKQWYAPQTFAFKKPKEAKELINQAVTQMTEGKIQNLVENVSTSSALLMANAALFKGSWSHPFKSQDNSIETFYNADGTTVKVEMMNQNLDDLRLAYDFLSKIEILELPFHGSLTLWLVKPCMQLDTKKATTILTTYMTEKNISQLIAYGELFFDKSRGLSIGIPKLNFQDKTNLLEELNPKLREAILKTDFSGSLVQTVSAVHIPEIISAVNFQMDEQGTAITAASYVPSYNSSCDPTFKLDGPFGVILVDCQTNTILGMGQVLNMADKKES